MKTIINKITGDECQTPHASRLTLHAFTLLELLVVIFIIAILAAFLLPITAAVKRHQYIYTAQAEMAQLESAINTYKSIYGFYPPDNSGNALTNQLYYELIGTTNIGTTANPTYQTLDGSITTSSNELTTAFGPGVTGIVNCSRPGGGEDARAAQSFLSGLKPGQIGTNVIGAATVKLLLCSVRGPDATYKPLGVPDMNPWRYNSSNPTNNPGGYDLWIQLLIGGKTNLICNWNRQPQLNSGLP